MSISTPGWTVPPRSLAARRERAKIGGALGPGAAVGRGAGGPDDLSHRRSCSRCAFPDRRGRKRGNGSFMLANGRGAKVEATSALARAPYLAVAEMTGTAARAAFCWPRRSRWTRSNRAFRRADRDARRGQLRCGAIGAARAAQARRWARSHWPSSARGVAIAGYRADAGRRAVARGPTVALVESRDAVARPRDVLAPAEGDEMAGSVRRGARRERDDWLAPALYDKTSLKDISAGELSDA